MFDTLKRELVGTNKVNEYDQEIPQPQTADQPKVSWERDTEH